ncbi:MAG: hypothetical protein AAFZ15_01680 [Bacteroidota bacterium]
MAPIAVLLFFLQINIVYSQHYVGIGIHAAPPARIDNCCNPFIKAKPTLMPAWSVSYKRHLPTKKGKVWYYEMGMTTQGLNFNYHHYLNNLESAWVQFNMSHVGFFSPFVGSGYVFNLSEKKNKQQLTVGLEGSVRVTHDLGGLRNSNFGVTFNSSDLTSPVFLRLNLGYSHSFKLFKKIPIHFQLYTKLSAQDIAVSPQYIRNPSTEILDQSGKYRLNNSEAGLKLYTDLGKEYYHFHWERKNKKKNRKRTGPSKYRFSAEAQLYRPSATKYFVPQVDSFSLEGAGITLTSQYGIKAAFVHAKNENWATIAGIGFGEVSENYQFTAISEYTLDGTAVSSGTQSGSFNRYLIPNIGLAYKHRFGKKLQLQHSLSSTLVVPLGKEDSDFFQVEQSFADTPPHLIPTFILKGNVDHEYGRDAVLAGLEYQPELLLRMDKPVFFAIGMVFNYSYGIVGQGRVTVDNVRTPYYGGFTQGFSKVGFSVRTGWQFSK